MTRYSPLWLLPPIAVGLGVAVWLVSQTPGPAQLTEDRPGPAVRVATVAAAPLRPEARGWGNVRAADTWTSIAEVRGTVIWRHPDLEPGRLIPAGTEVLRIDPADYELAIAQAEADIGAFAAEAGLIDTEAANTARILEIETARLAIAEADLIRTRALASQGATPQTRADEAERATLAVRRSVAELQNTAALIQPRRERLAAQTARTEAALGRARRDLDHTRITTPFDVRVTGVTAEAYRAVTVGQSLITADGIDRVEVVAQVPVAMFQRLLPTDARPGDVLSAMRTGPSALIEADLHLIADPDQVWQGSVTRIEGALDPRARTVPVVVEIRDPYTNAAPPLRLPLVPNMQVEVRLRGAILPAAITIPDSALHGGLAYALDSDNRLDLRPVTRAFAQDGRAIITEGLVPGDRIVLDDITPAIPGMALTPVEVTE